MIRTLIADDHRIFLQGLRRLLGDYEDISVVAEAGNCAEVIDAVRSRNLDVAVLDLSMPGRDGAELIAYVKGIRPSLKVLVMTMHKDEAFVMASLRAGADGYVLKDDAAEQLVAGIRQLARGGRYLCPEVAESIATSIPLGVNGKPAHTRLTEREHKVFRMLIAGKRGSEIALELAVSEKTVSTHKAHVLRKMHMNNRTELVMYAIKHQLIQA
jgi:two-component system, NarL family, invasion response regulator UvrY